MLRFMDRVEIAPVALLHAAYTWFVTLDQGHEDGVDHELRAWIKSLARRPTGRPAGERPEFSPEAAAYLHRIATDGTLKAALQEIAAEDPDLAD